MFGDLNFLSPAQAKLIKVGIFAATVLTLGLPQTAQALPITAPTSTAGALNASNFRAKTLAGYNYILLQRAHMDDDVNTHPTATQFIRSFEAQKFKDAKIDRYQVAGEDKPLDVVHIQTTKGDFVYIPSIEKAIKELTPDKNLSTKLNLNLQVQQRLADAGVKLPKKFMLTPYQAKPTTAVAFQGHDI